MSIARLDRNISEVVAITKVPPIKERMELLLRSFSKKVPTKMTVCRFLTTRNTGMTDEQVCTLHGQIHVLPVNCRVAESDGIRSDSDS